MPIKLECLSPASISSLALHSLIKQRALLSNVRLHSKYFCNKLVRLTSAQHYPGLIVVVKHKEELEKEEAELWTSGWIEESTKQMSVRPKTPKKRKERAVLKTPEERKVFNYANRLGFDGKLFEVTKINKGKQICISRKSPDIIPAVNVDGNIVITENFLLYHRLKAMNLRDPETIEKIKKACSSPQKTTKDSGK